MSKYKAAPNDSRYIPFTQQPYCCVPVNIQMIMYRNNIPLVPAEEIGYHLGLTVPKESAHSFYKVRTATKAPDGIWGTRISNPQYEPNRAFKKMGIPLSFELVPISSIDTPKSLENVLKDVQEQDTDASLCFNFSVTQGKYDPGSGHVVVFDRFIDDKIRYIESDRGTKWDTVDVGLLHKAMQKHGDANYAGIWLFNKI